VPALVHTFAPNHIGNNHHIFTVDSIFLAIVGCLILNSSQPAHHFCNNSNQVFHNGLSTIDLMFSAVDSCKSFGSDLYQDTNHSNAISHTHQATFQIVCRAVDIGS
jgi:hypothetical protein